MQGWAGWLALAAVWLQVLLPTALHSTAMADIPSIVAFADDDDDDGCALQHEHDDDDAGADHHHGSEHAGHAGCVACQAMHGMVGGFAPVLQAVPQAQLATPAMLAWAAVEDSLRNFPCAAFLARGPPRSI